MSTLTFIGLLGIGAYNCSAIHVEFKGSSLAMRTIQGVAGSVGYLTYFAALIWSFWHYAWWMPIVTAVASIVIGSMSAVLFQRTIVGMILSPIFVLVFAVLSIIGLWGA